MMDSSRQQNSRYVRALWLRSAWIILPSCGFIVWASIAEHFSAGNIAGMVAPLALLLLAARQLGFARAKKIMRQKTADDAIAIFSRVLSAALSERDAFLASARANFYLLWAEQKNAAEALASVDWQKFAPYIQGSAVLCEALREYLLGHAEEGLALTHRAAALTEIPNVPGAAARLKQIQIYVDVGETLRGDAEAFVRLQKTKTVGANAAIAAWAIDTARARRGEKVDFAAARRIAPYAIALHAPAGEVAAVERQSNVVFQPARRPLKWAWMFYAFAGVLWLLFWVLA